MRVEVNRRTKGGPGGKVTSQAKALNANSNTSRGGNTVGSALMDRVQSLQRRNMVF